MSVGEWCKLNHVSRSCLYAWMARFREEEPGRFPCRKSAVSKWIEATRGGIADGKAIVPACVAVADSTGEPPLPAGAAIDAGDPPAPAAAQPICAIANGIKVLVPPGAAESDVAAVLRAAASL